MLSIRKRGAVWHCRGTVKVGLEARAVQEHSTGLREKGAARAYAAGLERRLQREILEGDPGRPQRVSFAEVGAAYIAQPGLHPTDIWRIGEINEVLGEATVDELPARWPDFVRERCAGLAPGTVNRFRTALLAALNHSARQLGYAAPAIPKEDDDSERIRFLSIPDADRLVAAYAPHVQPIALVLRLHGPRTQEALQLPWQAVDVEAGTIWFERSKRGAARLVTMHARVAASLRLLWEKRGRPTAGHVFLNRLGAPYADTRAYKLPGGNPLAKAHATALGRAEVHPIGGDDFRVHDWRHHFACHAVMNGVDLPTIKRLGGWKTLQSLERYTAVSTEHMAAAVAKMR